MSADPWLAPNKIPLPGDVAQLHKEAATYDRTEQATTSGIIGRVAGVTIPRSALHTALRQAERSADEVWHKISELQSQRDDLVRRAGVVQSSIDSLRGEHEARTHHVRTLACTSLSDDHQARTNAS